MNNELGILFMHHSINDVTLNNLSSIQKYNPNATIVTISAGEPLPNGYSLNSTPTIKKIHSANISRGGDWLVCSWFIQRKEKCKKWWLVEWDTFCRTSVMEYYQPVWNFPYVASSVRLRHREPKWRWFKLIEDMPEELRPYAMGVVPFMCLISDFALELVCSTLLQRPFLAGNSELRFATIANKHNIAPCGFSPPNDQISWTNLITVTNQRTIFHPVKHIANIK